ncbi:uncharacterized protein A1O9_05151 [Exophiala aquamarina CBS 119918]|uniref:NmrA-like domain-containing protein n=1 Tax=Exophiala aquamarina CBS 119918 TaxID=1182545 RepID=A0A072PXJ7_9EURO|nr:uncharacterized protein A1O9_05151 [Exophiala aquamarina CBS 119918]KEF60300.1 hypothetical protein A1O9_05151 [Exophiala aquamarina CBS 119918]
MIQKGADENYKLAYQVGKAAQFPLFAPVEDTGKFVKPALKRSDQFNGKQILAATDYYTVDRITSEFQEVTGKSIRYVQVRPE